MGPLTTLRSWQSLRLGAAVRVCALVALLAPALWTRDEAALFALLAIGAMWGLGEISEMQPSLPVALTTILEPLCVGVICGFALHTSTAMLGALAVGPLTAGLRAGASGALTAFAAEMAGTVIVAAGVYGPLDGEQGIAIVTWGVAALGLGMIATFLHSALRREPDPLAPYHDAQALIHQLIDLSGGFSSGLDPTTLGTSILTTVRDELPTTSVAIYVPRDHDLTPLVAVPAGTRIDGAGEEALAVESWTSARSLVRGRAFAFPLSSGGTAVGVVAGRVSERLDPARLGLEGRTRELAVRLGPSTVRLDTALLFECLRDRATAVERHRLAREMHDGLAQDIASLGYLTDALAARPASPDQAAQIEALRQRITAVVSEVRRSVVSLRTGVGDSASLGTALGTVARHLTESSGVPVHVTLDERETRLRPEVEAELFRIAQQAMTNAVRHAQATAIDVHCRVRPPRAVITVRDDGHGLGPARPDSQGLEIMRERATLIGARLDVEQRRPHGTSVTVRVPAPVLAESVSA
jgi:signal transduction histidine kinase